MIKVLELKVPEGGDLSALRPALPVFLAYVLSFTNVGLVWNNHHHVLHATRRVNGAVLWANLFLLFWLSLGPKIRNPQSVLEIFTICPLNPRNKFLRSKIGLILKC